MPFRSESAFRFHVAIRTLLVAACASVAGACSSSLTTLQPARTTPSGHVSATTSVQVTLPMGLPGDILEAVQLLDDVSDDPSAQEVRAMADAATAALIQPPSLDGQLRLAVGLGDRLELSGRVGAASAGGGVRLQWLRQRPGIYGALGFAVDVVYNRLPVERLTNRVEIDRFERMDFSVPLVLGYSRRGVHLWAGPKLVISRFSSDVRVCAGSDDVPCDQVAALGSRGRARYIAGQVGLALGSGRFWFAAEITVARAEVRAQHTLDMPEHDRIEADHRLVGRVITPSIGLILWM